MMEGLLVGRGMTVEGVESAYVPHKNPQKPNTHDIQPPGPPEPSNKHPLYLPTIITAITNT